MHAIINSLINLISNIIILIMHSLNQPIGWLCLPTHIHLLSHSSNHSSIIIAFCFLAETELALLCLVFFDLGLITVNFIGWGNSFLIEFFTTFPNMPLCFSAILFHQNWWFCGTILWAMHQSSLSLNWPIVCCVIRTSPLGQKIDHCFHCFPCQYSVLESFKHRCPLWEHWKLTYFQISYQTL